MHGTQHFYSVLNHINKYTHTCTVFLRTTSILSWCRFKAYTCYLDAFWLIGSRAGERNITVYTCLFNLFCPLFCHFFCYRPFLHLFLKYCEMSLWKLYECWKCERRRWKTTQGAAFIASLIDTCHGFPLQYKSHILIT